jgi:teichuronic acid biosynthesis glycosyltransferase TuaC
VVYPAYYYTPKVLRNHYGTFLRWSVRGAVQRVLRNFRPDAVLGYWAHPDGEVAVRIAQQLGVPSGVIIGGSDVLLLTRNPGRKRRVMGVLQAASHVITVNHHLRDTIVDMGIPGEKIHVWEQGVDTAFSPADRGQARQRLGLPAGGRTAVWVGRMVPVKALEVLLDACRQLKQSGLEFTMYLVGDGPLRKRLEAQAAAGRLAGSVVFVGTQMHDRLPDWYRAVDFTVLPSWSEGLPNVLRESLACGTPFVASRVGGISEIAGEHHDWLVPPGDPLGLAAAMVRMWEGGGEAPQWHQPPTWRDAARALIDIFQPPAVHQEQRQLTQAGIA